MELVVGPRSSPTSRKAILPHIDDLAAFLGRRQVLHLLTAMPAMFNACPY